MKALSLQTALLVVAGVLALGAAFSAFAADEPQLGTASTAVSYQQGEDGGDEGFDVVPGLVWTSIGVLVGAVVLAVFYMLKRRVGGFPSNPSWVAPITIMPSREFPDEGDYGDQTPSHQAHAEH